MKFPSFSELSKIARRRSSGGVLFDGDGNIVLVQEIDGSWSFPKGGIGEGESPLDAAMREIKEETGIRSLSPLKSLGRYYRPTRKGKKRLVFMYLFRVDNQKLQPRDRRNPQAKFFSFKNAVSKLYPQDASFLQSVKNIIKSYIN